MKFKFKKRQKCYSQDKKWGCMQYFEEYVEGKHSLIRLFTKSAVSVCWNKD